ncbi:MAG: magnesium-translocating P-type ATPase [Chloroflexi bacterium]|nr:magnesium-translocating P-type ATPase [Chloroflexota bacterium]
MKLVARFFARTQPHVGQQDTQVTPAAYWSLSPEQLLSALRATPNGLQPADAEQRLKRYRPNTIQAQRQATALGLFLNQFKSPLVLILIGAAMVSVIVGEWTDAVIVLAVVLGSTLLGFVQEYRAGNAVQKLRSQVTIRSNVLRGGQSLRLPSEDVVPGDVVLLSAGSLIPADGVVLVANDFFVNQAVLTGETFPVEKQPGTVPAQAGLAERTNCVFMGTSVSSGTAQVLMVQTGKATVFGQIAQRLSLRPPETEFERGIHRFGNLLTQVMLVMVIIVLAVNLFLAKPLIDSLLFALALAVGLTPELLPAIISITLSHGAQRMAKRGVIVRRLNSIENFGSMDVLCTDKTGTLTEGVVRLDGALDTQGQPSQAVLRYAYLNAQFQTGLNNPLDEAIQAYAQRAGSDISAEQKVDEIPYDFVRKRLSVITANAQGERTLITKGALDNVLSICNSTQSGEGAHPLDATSRAGIERLYSEWSAKGFRVLGVATKTVDRRPEAYSRADESALTFAGFLLFFDPPKADVRQAIVDLAKRGVQIKIITGDNQKVARHIAEAVDLPVMGVLTGSELDDLRDEALWHLAERTTLFAEVDPNQKERIILALRKTGHVVGYMGDGINDTPALHAADVGLSVDTAVDVAKDAADFVLLKTDLGILREGIDEGRKTFANTLKYILTTVSANFGNMFSMAGASMLLPFLPLLASQILLNNFLSDIPATTIAGDNVDPEWLEKPRRWNTLFIRNYMVLFGLVSSIFDILTFGTLLFLFRATPEVFRTGWFIESLLTELVIALVVRTRHPFFRSRPGTLLLVSTLVFIGLTLVLPYLPSNVVFGFIPLPAPLMLTVLGLTALYVLATELAKRYFYSRVENAVA